MNNAELIAENVFEPSLFSKAVTNAVESTTTVAPTVTMASSAVTSIDWGRVATYALAGGLFLVVIYLLLENHRLQSEIERQRDSEQSVAQ